MFPLLLPQLPRDLFLLSLFLGKQTLLSCFCGILVSLLQLCWTWPEAQDLSGAVKPLEFSLSCLLFFCAFPEFLNFFLSFSPNVCINIWPVCHVIVLRESILFCREILPSPHAHTEVRSSKFCHVFAEYSAFRRSKCSN